MVWSASGLPAQPGGPSRSQVAYWRVRILVTNDDGVHAPGLAALTRALAAWAADDPDGEDRQVVVVAPLANYSGAAAAVGTVYEREAIAYKTAVIPGAESVEAYGLDASPALSVIVGALGAFGPRPDLVVSGINLGVNVGRSVLHSGTVGAVLTGAQLGMSGLAVSLRSGGAVDHWDTASALAVEVLPAAGRRPAPHPAQPERALGAARPSSGACAAAGSAPPGSSRRPRARRRGPPTAAEPGSRARLVAGAGGEGRGPPHPGGRGPLAGRRRRRGPRGRRGAGGGGLRLAHPDRGGARGLEPRRRRAGPGGPGPPGGHGRRAERRGVRTRPWHTGVVPYQIKTFQDGDLTLSYEVSAAATTCWSTCTASCSTPPRTAGWPRTWPTPATG